VFQFLAALRAEFLQQHNVLTCLCQLSGLDIELAKVFEGTLVVWVEVERLLVESVGGLGITALAQAEAQQVIDVGVLHTVVDHAVEVDNGRLELLGLDLGSHCRQVRCLSRGGRVDGLYGRNQPYQQEKRQQGSAASAYECRGAHNHLRSSSSSCPAPGRGGDGSAPARCYAFTGVKAYPLPSLAKAPAPGKGKWAPQIIIFSAITRSISLRRVSTASGPS